MNAIRWESPVKGRLREDRLVIGTSIAGPLAVLAVKRSPLDTMRGDGAFHGTAGWPLLGALYPRFEG
jgi:hypothetical protein